MKHLRFLLLFLLLSQTLLAKEEDDLEVLSIEETTMLEMVDSLSYIDSTQENRPEEEYQEIIYTPKQSTLHIPIHINVALLEKKLNDNFNGLIYEDAVIEDDSLMIRAWKERDFKIAYEQNILTYQVPIKIWVKKRFGLGFTYTDQEIEGSISLEMQTSINFSKDWGLITKTVIKNYEWIKKPVLKFGVIEIPITPIVDKILVSNKSFMSKTIDETVKKYIPLEEYVQKIWESIQDPMDISASGYKAWIKITPQKLYTTPITGSQGNINTTIGIQCLAEIYMDNIPVINEKIKTMPRFKMYTQTDEQVRVNLLADIPYTTIDSIGKDILVGESFGEGRHTITVDSLEIFGKDDKLIIGVFVNGFINGAIYLSGIPYYEQETSSIRIMDVDYRLQTKNFLAKIVNLFYKKGLKRMIEEKLIISLKDELVLVKESSRTELFNKMIMDNVYINGMLNHLNVENIYLTKNGLKVAVILSGKFNIRIE